MSKEFIERLNSGSLTQIEQYKQMKINLAPAARRLAAASGVADDWKDWELAPEWSADGVEKKGADEHLIGGERASSVHDAINALARDD